MNEAETKHSICREIFKAIHEGRWLSIEYQNKENKTTKYWIGIRDINPFLLNSICIHKNAPGKIPGGVCYTVNSVCT